MEQIGSLSAFSKDFTYTNFRKRKFLWLVGTVYCYSLYYPLIHLFIKDDGEIIEWPRTNAEKDRAVRHFSAVTGGGGLSDYNKRCSAFSLPFLCRPCTALAWAYPSANPTFYLNDKEHGSLLTVLRRRKLCQHNLHCWLYNNKTVDYSQ